MATETRHARNLLDLRERYVENRRQTIRDMLAAFDDRSRRSSLQDNLKLVDDQIRIIDVAVADERRLGELPVELAPSLAGE
ncbi:hypothetical protein [Phreatobacter stygius]|uniref:Uncharacterized protein n=1 Tax=Phreatobacter stygius TaxID=1940610 RepID=A0A4D7B556_9HYPH|nr:hypothetical protein [Phreatobacter stygius]QCI63362.1 hypothetical protein E8M01_03385 [Phreatobacter stygius]